MKKKFFLLSAIMLSGVILSSLLSCSSSEEIEQLEPKQVVNMLSESQPIELTPEQRVFANDNNGFTLNFLKTVNNADKSGKSFIYSPLSVTYVLGMVNDAATGQTEQELEQVMGFHQGGIKAVNDYCKKLIDGLKEATDESLPAAQEAAQQLATALSDEGISTMVAAMSFMAVCACRNEKSRAAAACCKAGGERRAVFLYPIH